MTIRLGIKARFTLLYGTALVLTVVMLSSGIYFFVRQALVLQIENHLRKDMTSIAEYLRHDPNGLNKLAEHGPIEVFQIQQGHTTVLTSDDWKQHGFDQIVKDGAQFTVPTSINTPTGKSFLLQSTIVNGAAPYLITVGHHEGAIRQTLRTLSQIILLILPVAVAFSLAIGYFIAGRVLAPIRTITRKAEEISADNLSDRLPVGNGEDEFSRLATVFNQAFARIEDSFKQLKRFTADASHELRTPLAAIRSIGETALHQTGEQGNCREAIGSILEETDRLRQMIDSLLLLSRASSGQVELQRETIDLTEMLRESVEFLNVLAEEKHQTFRLLADEKIDVLVDKSIMRQALINLLDNAIKYSPVDAAITIKIGRTTRGEPCVDVIDSGNGIPPQDLDRIFDRFYRVDKGRSRESGGAGLGLSIVSWAVGSHGGRVEVESNLGKGSRFRIIFPQ